MWFNLLKRRIELGINLSEIDDVLKFFVATGDITLEEYGELLDMLPKPKAESEEQ